jgi:hypothetical protein
LTISAVLIVVWHERCVDRRIELTQLMRSVSILAADENQRRMFEVVHR